MCHAPQMHCWTELHFTSRVISLLVSAACVRTLFDACRSSAKGVAPATAAVLTPGAKLSHGPRLKPKKLSGSWKAFDLTAVPIDETDPSTGKYLWAAIHCNLV